MWVAETSSTSYEGRASLARRATELARAAMPGVDVEILWDGMWVRRVGPDYFPDPDMFRLSLSNAGPNAAPNWERWAGQAAKHLHDAEDYWFYLYKPRAGDAIVDIGAGRGEDVFAFSRAVGPAVRVWAIEPHPVSFGALGRLCELNRRALRAASRFICGARQLVTTQPVGECDNAELRVHGPGREIADRNAAGMGV